MNTKVLDVIRSFYSDNFIQEAIAVNIRSAVKPGIDFKETKNIRIYFLYKQGPCVQVEGCRKVWAYATWEGDRNAAGVAPREGSGNAAGVSAREVGLSPGTSGGISTTQQASGADRTTQRACGAAWPWD